MAESHVLGIRASQSLIVVHHTQVRCGRALEHVLLVVKGIHFIMQEVPRYANVSSHIRESFTYCPTSSCSLR